MRKLITTLVFIYLPILVYSQSLQIYGGMGRNGCESYDMKSDGSYPTNYRFETDWFMTAGLNLHYKIVNKLALQAGGGISYYQYTVNNNYYQLEASKKYKIRYVALPIGVRYEFFKNFNIQLGMQWNFDPVEVSKTNLIEKLYKPIKIYYYGANYIIFESIELGIIKHGYLSHFGERRSLMGREVFKMNSWYLYASYIFHLKQ